MSFREKSAWACSATILAVFVPCFVYVFRLFEREELKTARVIGAFVVAVFFSVILNVAAHIWIAIRCKQEQKDERDLAIESKSFKNAYYVLAISICLLLFVPTPWDHLLTIPLLGQVLLFCFVVAEVTKYLTQAVSYRRGS